MTEPEVFVLADHALNIAGLQQAALLNRAATLADVGNVAVFVASD